MSLLWKTAVEATEPDEYITHHDLAGMYSADFDEPMYMTRKNLRQDYRNWQNGGEQAHAKDREFGGPDNYIEHLKKDIAANGIREPLVIRGGNVVFEGHHRGVAAMDLRLNKIPVRHIR